MINLRAEHCKPGLCPHDVPPPPSTGCSDGDRFKHRQKQCKILHVTNYWVGQAGYHARVNGFTYMVINY